MNTEQARRNRVFIEKRFYQNQDDLNQAEQNYNAFQKKNGVFAVAEQITLAVSAVGELEAQLVEKQIMLYTLKGQMSENSIVYNTLKNQIDAIQKKINEMNRGKISVNGESLMIPFNQVPDLQLEYLRLFREVEIQNRIMQFIYPLYEQAKIEEQKSAPTVLVIDEAVAPQLKYAPKKAFIILFLTFLVFFIHLPFIFRGEKILSNETFRNPIEEKESGIYKKVLKFYKMKLE